MTLTATELDITDLDRQLTLVSQSRKVPGFELTAGISPDVVLTRTIDGASTLDVPIADYQRTLLRAAITGERCWVILHDPDGDIHFELVGLSKSGDFLTLRFEDAVAAMLRRQTDALTIPAGRMTIPEIARKLAAEPRSNVPLDVDTQTDAGRVTSVTQRGGKSGNKNSWDVLAAVVGPVKWRRFSTGRRLVVGSDPWLLGRKNPIRLRENTDGVVGTIDFEWDKGQPRNDVDIAIDARLLTITPGDPVELGDDMGPLADVWLASKFTRPLTSTTGTLTLTRKVKPLHEPKRVKAVGDPGDPDYTPGQTGTDPGGVVANAVRGRMVAFALAQSGKPYVYGSHGPSSWDCSGLVQGATAYAGKILPAPSISQWDRCVAEHKTISVAEGLKIRGALLFRIHYAESSPSGYNHVAISLGNGTTVEARGTGYGCGVFGGAAGGGWTGAALWV